MSSELEMEQVCEAIMQIPTRIEVVASPLSYVVQTSGAKHAAAKHRVNLEDLIC